MKGRVAILKGYGEGYDLEEHPVPEPEPGAMVAKVALAGICGSDLHAWRGDLSETSSPTFSSPQAPGLAQGHEMTGSVYRLGKGLTTDAMGQPLREGDRICYSIHFPCFHCPICVRGSFNMCPNRRGALPAGEWPHFTGTFADYFYLPPNHFAFKAPPELSDEVLAPVNCAMAAVLQGLSSVGVTEGDSVVIQGAGALGISATAFAKDLGAHPIIVLDMLEHRLAVAADFGADHTVKVDAFASDEDRIEHVRGLAGGVGADLVVELVGKAELLPEGVAMLRRGGTFLEIGNMVWGRTVPFDPSTILQGKRIIGSAGSHPSMIPKVLDFLVKNRERYPFERLASHKFNLADINHAFGQADWATGKSDVIRAYLAP